MSNLTCNEFDGLLAERTAGAGDVDTPLALHASSCSRCAAIWSEEQALDAAVSSWKAAVPQADLAGRVVAAWLRECRPVTVTAANDRQATQHPPQGSRHRALLAVVAAAGVLLAVALLSQGPREPARSDPQSPHIAGNTKPPIPVPGPGSSRAEEFPVDQLLAGMRGRYSGAASRVSQMVDGWKFPWPAMADVDVNLMPRNGVRASKPATPPNAAGELGETLKPIGRDVRKAFSFLRDAVPGLDGSST